MVSVRAASPTSASCLDSLAVRPQSVHVRDVYGSRGWSRLTHGQSKKRTIRVSKGTQASRNSVELLLQVKIVANNHTASAGNGANWLCKFVSSYLIESKHHATIHGVYIPFGVMKE